MPWSSHRVRLACGLLCAGAMLGVAHSHDSLREGSPAVYAAYYEQIPVPLALPQVGRGDRPFNFGPWRLGARVRDPKPSDRRPNLYLIVPGVQHQLDGAPDWNHNAVVSIPPPEERPAEWDVFWVVVLDPALDRDLRSERDLLMAGQTAFAPSDLFEFGDLPGAAFLGRYFKMESLNDLARYRRSDGRLPRVIIIPAGYAIRASKAPTPIS